MRENFEEHGSLYETQNENLHLQILEAQKNAPTLEEVEECENKANEILEKFIRGEYSLREFIEKDKEITIPGRVELPDFDSLEDAFNYVLKDPESAKELADHERNHAKELEKSGIKFKIFLVFYKNNRKISLNAQLDFKLSEDDDEKEIKDRIKAAIEAPEDSSDTDEKQLEFWK